MTESLNTYQSSKKSPKAYNLAKLKYKLLNFSLSVALLVILLWAGLSIPIRAMWERVSGDQALIILGYFLTILAAAEALSLPVELAGGHLLDRRYGLSNQSARAWLVDHSKGTALSAILGAALVEIFYWLLRRSPNWWWAEASAIVFFIFLIISFIAPVVLLPIFFKAKPIGNKALQDRLMRLSREAGAPAVGVYEIDLSKKTKAANAGIAGLGATRRIILSDTLLNNFDEDEIEIVFAHELGHNQGKDIWKMMALQSLLSALGLYISQIILKGATPYFGFKGPADVANLPLLILVFTAVGLAFYPLANAYSRLLELRADRFAMTKYKNPGAFISSMEKLAELNLADTEPNRAIEFILYSHPSVSKRIKEAQKFMAA